MDVYIDRAVFDQAKKNLHLAETKRKKRFKNLQQSVKFTLPSLCGAAWWVSSKWGFRWTVLLVILYFGFYALALMFNNSASKIDYKQIFLTPVLKALFPHLGYKPLEYQSMKTFEKSNLYPGMYDVFTGDDLFTGSITGRQFSFSDLEVTRHSKNSANWNHNTVIFKGIFINATLPETFTGGFIIEPKPTTEPGKSAIVKLIRKFSTQRVEQVAQTGFPMFDNLFQLLTLDLGQSMQLLTVRRMNMILELGKAFDDVNSKFPKNELYPEDRPVDKVAISLSVYGNQLYLGIRNIHLFDLPFDSNLTDSEVLFIKSVRQMQLIDQFVSSW